MAGRTQHRDNGDATRAATSARHHSCPFAADRGSFTLASGRASRMFFDMKPTMLDPEAANLIADAVLDRLG